MTSDKLGNLVRIGKLKEEPPSEKELQGLKSSAVARLADAERRDLSFESRFDLTYNAAHALALYALRRNLAEYEGYLERDEQLLADMISTTRALSAALGMDEGL